MYCSPAARLAALLALVGGLPYGCARKPAARPIRLAILRFENLGNDPSADWMGRAFADIVTSGLSATPGITIVPASRLRAFNSTLGPRPVSAPGISSERALALVAGANRIGYGDYNSAGGRLQARFTIEDTQTGRMTQTVSVVAEDVSAAASALVSRISSHPVPYGTRSLEALKAWTAAQEPRDAAAARQSLEQAIAADPDFPPPYRALAEWMAARQDRAGALGVLGKALARGNRIPELERARIEVEAASLRNDAPARERALAGVLKLDPRDAPAWRALAQGAFTRRDFAPAIQAYQRSLELEPDDANSENQLAYAAAYGGDLDTAVRALRRYQAMRPTDPNPLDSMGDVHLITGHPREAEGFYLEALKKDPNFLNNADYFKAAMARLMTGDLPGADALAARYADARAAAHDPLADSHRAEWSWISGRRKAGYRQLAEFARAAETGPRRELASRAYAELAIWSLLLGDPASAAEMARKSAPLAGQPSAGLSLVARFLAQPPASSAEWAARADRIFPNAPRNSVRDLTLAYALLLDREFQPASQVLKGIYDAAAPGGDEGTPYLLAWTLFETGRAGDAAPLLRANPVPPPTGAAPMMSFYFPRIYYLRGLAAEKQGNNDEARANYQLFKQLSGDTPFVWDR